MMVIRLPRLVEALMEASIAPGVPYEETGVK
jgi:hypothetical protein